MPYYLLYIHQGDSYAFQNSLSSGIKIIEKDIWLRRRAFYVFQRAVKRLHLRTNNLFSKKSKHALPAADNSGENYMFKGSEAAPAAWSDYLFHYLYSKATW